MKTEGTRDAWSQAEHELLMLLRRKPLDKEASYDDNARAILGRLRAALSADTEEDVADVIQRALIGIDREDLRRGIVRSLLAGGEHTVKRDGPSGDPLAKYKRGGTSEIFLSREVEVRLPHPREAPDGE